MTVEFHRKRLNGIINKRSKEINPDEQDSAMEPGLRQAFDHDVYSQHFNFLRVLGQWNIEIGSHRKKYLHNSYRFFTATVGCLVGVSGLIDLYLSRSDFNKIVFNICTTMLITGIWIKNLHVQFHCDRLNKLRHNLFTDGWEQRWHPEDVEIRNQFIKILIIHRKVFYFAASSLLPIWLITSLTTLKWGPRQLPFSVWTPVNLDDDIQFFWGFLYHSLGSLFVVTETIHADLAMFSLLLQIATQYCILAKNVKKVDEGYKNLSAGDIKRDINKTLLYRQTKEKLRRCVKVQLKLMGYVKELETVYSKPMMIQLICGFVLSIGNGLELIVVSMNFSVKLSYQVGYTLIVLGDVFMCCNLADLLIAQGQKVVWSLYDIAWFDMDPEIRKYLVLITIGAQRIQPLTAAKMFNLNLTTFLGLLKNVYSWLALFRQLVIKK